MVQELPHRETTTPTDRHYWKQCCLCYAIAARVVCNNSSLLSSVNNHMVSRLCYI